MTFNGKISEVWTENMYVAAELWSLRWTDVFIAVPLSRNMQNAKWR